jgi:hypothetical protein
MTVRYRSAEESADRRYWILTRRMASVMGKRSPEWATRGVIGNWGTSDEERARPFPCDGIISTPDAILHRGVTVRAEAVTLYRWLCQLRIAPYSYDWIDNRCRRSPRRLTAGLDDLQLGMDVMRIFALVGFDTGRSMTLRIRSNTRAARVFGDVAGSYVIDQQSPGTCRLLVRLVVRFPGGFVGWLAARALPAGDLLMMRRQLLTLKGCAESQS